MSWMRIAVVSIALVSLLTIVAGAQRVQFTVQQAEAAQPPAPPPVRTQTQVPNHPLPAPTQRPLSPQH